MLQHFQFREIQRSQKRRLRRPSQRSRRKNQGRVSFPIKLEKKYFEAQRREDEQDHLAKFI